GRLRQVPGGTAEEPRRPVRVRHRGPLPGPRPHASATNCADTRPGSVRGIGRRKQETFDPSQGGNQSRVDEAGKKTMTVWSGRTNGFASGSRATFSGK